MCGVQIKEIVKLAPRKRQTLLFSATMTEQVQQLVTMSLKSPVRLAADAAGRAPEELRQEIVRLKVSTHSRSTCPSCSACGPVYSCVLIDFCDWLTIDSSHQSGWRLMQPAECLRNSYTCWCVS